MERFVGLFGIVALLGLALAMSSKRSRVDWKIVALGLGLQVVIAFLVIKFPPVVQVFDTLAGTFNGVISAADSAIAFMFGGLSNPGGPWGFVFAVRVMPVIIFFSALMAVLYHVGLMQRVVAVLAWGLRGALRVTGTEALVVAANVFMGQTEAPLCIRPYLDKLSRSQIMVLMVGGFATIAGSVLAGYVSLLGEEYTRHFIAASLMSAPAAFVLAKILEPETGTPVDGGLDVQWGGSEDPGPARGSRKAKSMVSGMLDAASRGTTDGLKLAVNVCAMLIAFIALLNLVNLGLAGWSQIPVLLDHTADPWPVVTLESILGWLLQPVAFLLGAPWHEADKLGSLIGQKIVLTEFIAYGNLAEMSTGPDALSERTRAIAAYALCGFANFPSIAIQIGGLSALVPSRRSEIAGLGLRAMLGGALASAMTAAIAGLFI